jgi:hypothetical protein
MSEMKIEDAIKEIQQSQSKYQYEKFVIGQHDSPEMQYYQTVVEASSRIRNLKETELKIKKLEAEIEELLKTGKKSDAIQAEILGLQIEETNLQLIGQRRELEILEDIFSQYPNYTREEIEAAQPEYWNRRLIRTAQLQLMSGHVDWAQLEAIHQAGILPQAIEALPTMSYLENKAQELLTIEFQKQQEQEK